VFYVFALANRGVAITRWKGVGSGSRDPQPCCDKTMKKEEWIRKAAVVRPAAPDIAFKLKVMSSGDGMNAILSREMSPTCGARPRARARVPAYLLAARSSG